MLYPRLNPYTQIQLLTKLLEQEVGYDEAHSLIEQAELEHAVLERCSNVETR